MSKKVKKELSPSKERKSKWERFSKIATKGTTVPKVSASWQKEIDLSVTIQSTGSG